jgi:hypothetical protein
MVKHKYGGGLIAASLLTLALPLLASCSSGSPDSASVAQLGGSASASASPTSSMSAYQTALAYSQCMRSHGVPNFPDPSLGPGGTVGIQIKGGSGLDPNSSAFKAAQQACHSLQPGGQDNGRGSFNPAKIAPWAACIRQHGVPDFADPTNTGSGMKISLPSDVDPSKFQSAAQACSSLSPGGTMMVTGSGGGGGGGTGG